MKRIILNCDYVQGYLRGGYFVLELNEEQYKEFESMSKKEQLDYIEDCGDLEIDSYRVEDYETGEDFEIYNLD